MTDPKTIHQALADVKAAVGAVGKTGRNTQQGYDFRGIDAVVNAAAGPLNREGVIVMPTLDKIQYTDVTVGKNKTPMAHVRVEVTYTFHGPKGDKLETKVPGEAMDSGDKATAKAMSVAYRIALLQALNLPTCEPDPDEDTYERSEPETAQTLAVAAHAAPNLDTLRAVYGKAADAGHLDHTIHNPDGEPVTLRDFITTLSEQHKTKEPIPA